jgi:hypothetical protein
MQMIIKFHNGGGNLFKVHAINLESGYLIDEYLV